MCHQNAACESAQKERERGRDEGAVAFGRQIESTRPERAPPERQHVEGKLHGKENGEHLVKTIKCRLSHVTYMHAHELICAFTWQDSKTERRSNVACHFRVYSFWFMVLGLVVLYSNIKR